MDRVAVERWVQDYERLWRTPGVDQLGALFSADAEYRTSPWSEPVRGLDEIAELWDTERDGPDEEFTMSSEVVAVDGQTAVVRVSVEYGDPSAGRWRDLWLLRFDDGRCTWFEEWPFAPSRPDGDDDSLGG